MRRSGQPSLPSAMTCCFFDSFKTLLMPTQPTRLHRDSMSGTSLPLAGFQVIIIGRFWVITEGQKWLLLSKTSPDQSVYLRADLRQLLRGHFALAFGFSNAPVHAFNLVG